MHVLPNSAHPHLYSVKENREHPLTIGWSPVPLSVHPYSIPPFKFETYAISLFFAKAGIITGSWLSFLMS